MNSSHALVLAGTATALQGREARQLRRPARAHAAGFAGARLGRRGRRRGHRHTAAGELMTSRRVARTQARYKFVPGGVPPEFLLGRCVEVWGDGFHSDPHHCLNRYTKAVDVYVASIGSDRRAWPQTALGPAPWSVDYLDADGRGDQVDHRLAAVGVTPGRPAGATPCRGGLGCDVPAAERSAGGRLGPVVAARVERGDRAHQHFESLGGVDACLGTDIAEQAGGTNGDHPDRRWPDNTLHLSGERAPNLVNDRLPDLHP